MGPVERGTRADLRRAGKSLDDSEEQGYGDIQALLVAARAIDSAREQDDYVGLASNLREYRQLRATILDKSAAGAHSRLTQIQADRQKRKPKND